MSNEQQAALTDFGGAIYALKHGKKVARNGWNGKGMWLSCITPTGYAINCVPEDERDLVQLPFIAMKTADNKIVPWLASQSDVLAEDWVIIQ